MNKIQSFWIQGKWHIYLPLGVRQLRGVYILVNSICCTISALLQIKLWNQPRTGSRATLATTLGTIWPMSNNSCFLFRSKHTPFDNLSCQNKHSRIHTMFKCSLYYHFMFTWCRGSKNKQICTQVACKRLDYVMQFPCVATCGTIPCINECSILWQWEWNNYNVELWGQQCNSGDAWGQRLKGSEALTIGYYCTVVFGLFNDTISGTDYMTSNDRTVSTFRDRGYYTYCQV